jgi:hypothetical protein
MLSTLSVIVWKAPWHVPHNLQREAQGLLQGDATCLSGVMLLASVHTGLAPLADTGTVHVRLTARDLTARPRASTYSTVVGCGQTDCVQRCVASVPSSEVRFIRLVGLLADSAVECPAMRP